MWSKVLATRMRCKMLFCEGERRLEREGSIDLTYRSARASPYAERIELYR